MTYEIQKIANGWIVRGHSICLPYSAQEQLPETFCATIAEALEEIRSHECAALT